MKYCEDRHENKDDANFCATCGKPILRNDFTLDKYPDIKFEVTDYQKYCKFQPVKLLFGLLPAYLFLEKNSDFMESTCSKCGYKRIAKNGKLGLFDINANSVRLFALFDDIVDFDSHHYRIQKNGKYGIYSTVFHKVIVPCKYVSISLRSEGVFLCAMDKGNVVYYSCKGKVVR